MHQFARTPPPQTQSGTLLTQYKKHPAGIISEEGGPLVSPRRHPRRRHSMWCPIDRWSCCIS